MVAVQRGCIYVGFFFTYSPLCHSDYCIDMKVDGKQIKSELFLGLG